MHITEINLFISRYRRRRRHHHPIHLVPLVETIAVRVQKLVLSARSRPFRWPLSPATAPPVNSYEEMNRQSYN